MLTTGREMSFLKLGRHEEAVAAYNEAIRLNPRMPRSHQKGNALKNLGRNEEAVAAYNEAIRLVPENALAHNNKGVALRAWAQ